MAAKIARRPRLQPAVLLLSLLVPCTALRGAAARSGGAVACIDSAVQHRVPRWRDALPRGDELDDRILSVALPSIANLAVIPLVGAVDTFWIGRMGDALALAGQGAANQVFFSTYFLIAFIPTITAPLVAKAAGGGDIDGAARRVCEALFLANVLGALGTALLVLFPAAPLSVVLPPTAPAFEYARRYLRLRSLSLIPALLSSIGFAAFRGLLDNVTPLRVSLASNALNLVLDPVLIFGARLGVAGAAVATAASEVFAGGLYVALLLRRRLLRLGALLTPPRLSDLLPLLRGGAAMLLRQVALNVAFVSATRRTQLMDPTGVAAAAYSITNQVYSLGVVVMLAMQAAGATLVPSALARGGGGEGGAAGGGARGDGGATAAARRVADRLIGWSTLIAAGLGLAQAAAMPYLTPLFTPLPAVREAVAAPARVAALVTLTNGPIFAGEGIMMGLGAFGPLAAVTAAGVGVMVAGLSLSARLGLGVASVWWSLLAFHAVLLVGQLGHHLRLSPLATAGRGASSTVECAVLPPPVGEVCVAGEDAAA